MVRGRGIAIALLAPVLALASTSIADGRQMILDEDPTTLAMAVGPQPGGIAPLGRADGILQPLTEPVVLPSSRVASRVAGTTLQGRSAGEMASVLRAGIRSSAGRRVIVDDLGPGFRGSDGVALAGALAILAREPVTKGSSETRSNRVHIYVPDPGEVLTDPEWEGGRLALTRSGGVWLETVAGSAPWTTAQWLTWPFETMRLFSRGGVPASRVHVLFGPGDHEAMWRSARTGSACSVLRSGPGTQGVGASMVTFVAEFRRTLPASKKTTVGCSPAAHLGEAAARSLDAAAARETTGVELPSLMIPPVVAGAPTQLTLDLGPDPLGIATATGLDPEALWQAGVIQVDLSAPGVRTSAIVEGDGAARFQFTPSEPGPIAASIRLPAPIASIMAGVDPGTAVEVAVGLRRVNSVHLIERVVRDPDGWTIDVPLTPPGGRPGDPLTVVVPPPPDA